MSNNINFTNISAPAIFRHFNENTPLDNTPTSLKEISGIIEGGVAFGLSSEQIADKINEIAEKCEVEKISDFSEFAKIKRVAKVVPVAGNEYKLILCGVPAVAKCVYVTEYQGEPMACFEDVTTHRLSALQFRSINYCKD